MDKTAPEQPKRHKYEKEREQAIAMHMAGYSLGEIAKIIGCARSSVHGWIQKYKEENPDNEIERVRCEKGKEFAEQAWDIIIDAMNLLGGRVHSALEKEAELDVLIDTIASDKGISKNQKTAMINKVRALQIHNIRDLSTVIGTLYDKQALARGESTQNVGGLTVNIKVVE